MTSVQFPCKALHQNLRLLCRLPSYTKKIFPLLQIPDILKQKQKSIFIKRIHSLSSLTLQAVNLDRKRHTSLEFAKYWKRDEILELLSI